ncbi:hypothetical protein ACGGZK_02055 [Agromyces sp. MMS24-K17]|uniref:hypothetical protein n=1 Tax=Agromyces sp. MMS24-K17 TaxID=3372850 RepID=UPI003754AB95
MTAPPLRRGRGSATVARGAAVLVALLVGAQLVGAPLVAGPAVADDAEPADGNLLVVVTDGTPTPTPTPGLGSGGLPPGGSVVPRTGSGTGSTPAGSTGGTQPSQPAADPASTLPGEQLALLVSGVKVVNRSSLNPFVGALALEVTVSNLSEETVEVGADFGVANVLGMQVADATRTATLEPQEERTISVLLTGPVQQVLVNATAELTPPETIGGVEQKPVRRDAWTLAVPWLLVGVLVAVGGSAGLFRRLWGRR